MEGSPVVKHWEKSQEVLLCAFLVCAFRPLLMWSGTGPSLSAPSGAGVSIAWSCLVPCLPHQEPDALIIPHLNCYLKVPDVFQNSIFFMVGAIPHGTQLKVGHDWFVQDAGLTLLLSFFIFQENIAYFSWRLEVGTGTHSCFWRLYYLRNTLTAIVLNRLGWCLKWSEYCCRETICTLLDALLYFVLKNSFDSNGSSWSGWLGALIVIL